MNQQLEQAKADHERATSQPLNIGCAKSLRAEHLKETGTPFQRSPISLRWGMSIFAYVFWLGVVFAVLGTLVWLAR